jgi:uncharacterized protein YbjT (DUF2867 family)
MNRILLIGATGNVGSHVLAQLTPTGAPVRIMSRNPGKPDISPQTEVVYGDLALPETLDACLEDVDSVFLVWVAPPASIGPVVERIAKHARRIVFLSAPLKTPHPLFQQPNPVRLIAEEIERRIESSRLEWTFLRPHMLASNALNWWAPQIRAGNVVRWPYLSVPTAPIDERDIAAVGVRALCEDGHAGKDYVLTGPESLSQFEQVSIIGRAIGRSLAIEEMPLEDAPQELLSVLPSPVIAKLLLDAWAAAAGLPAHVTSTVAEVTGAPARTFFSWAADHAARFRGDQ